MINNKLWSSYEKSDPASIKSPTAGTKGLSSIDAYYMFQQATKAFGPCGFGWGYEITSEEYREGEPINDSAGAFVANKLHHIMHIKFWYKHEAETCIIQSIGTTEYLSKNKYGLSTDGEASKKSLTDAIKKALSMLGFCADVYMGKFDNLNYVEELKNEIAIENASDKDAERAKQAKASEIECYKTIEMMNTSSQMSELKGLYGSIIRKTKDEGLLRKLAAAKDKAKTRIEGAESE